MVKDIVFMSSVDDGRLLVAYDPEARGCTGCTARLYPGCTNNNRRDVETVLPGPARLAGRSITIPYQLLPRPEGRSFRGGRGKAGDRNSTRHVSSTTRGGMTN